MPRLNWSGGWRRVCAWRKSLAFSPFMFFHVPSCPFMSFHVLSCPFHIVSKTYPMKRQSAVALCLTFIAFGLFGLCSDLRRIVFKCSAKLCKERCINYRIGNINLILISILGFSMYGDSSTAFDLKPRHMLRALGPQPLLAMASIQASPGDLEISSGA